MQKQFEVTIEWRGFQLHPEIPPGGVRTADMFGERRAHIMAARMESFAAEFGVTMALPERVPFTLRPLAASEYARDQGKLEAFRDVLMDAHWLHGKDIESDRDLAEAAEQVGISADETLAAADSPAYRNQLKAVREQAFDQMVTAIPTFLFGSYPVVGCQRYDTLLRVADKIGVAHRPSG